MTRPFVFISYSHKDEVEKDRLLSHLGVLEPDLISVSSDDDIGPGADWATEIERKLAQASVAILLITADYLNSPFISKTEIPRLLDRYAKEGLVIIPLIAKACAWKKVPWLARMNVKPKGGKPVWGERGAHLDEDLAAIAEEVADIVQRAIESSREIPAETDDQPIEEPRVALPQVLIVDDDPDYRDSLKLIIRDKPSQILEAGSVNEAERILKENPDLRIVLLDLDLPDHNGTELLEHIKSQSAHYKVIILTNHADLLPASEARRQNVFMYLYKSSKDSPFEALRFALDQALSDIEREQLTKDNKADDFEDVILNRYPTPFTYIYQVLKSDLPGALDNLTSQKDMLELLLNFSALVLLCEYLNGGNRTQALDDHLHTKLQRPALGEWFNMISEILKNGKDQISPQFSKRFAASFLTGRNKKNINSLTTIRNKYLGHSSKRTESEYKQISTECDGLLIPLLQDYKFITEFLLCFVSSVQRVRGELWHRIIECTGANPQLLFGKRKFQTVLNAEEVYLISLADDRALGLHPFVVLKDCPKCGQPEIFFYSKFANGEMHYSSYRTGHTIATKDYLQDYVTLMRKQL